MKKLTGVIIFVPIIIMLILVDNTCLTARAAGINIAASSRSQMRKAIYNAIDNNLNNKSSSFSINVDLSTLPANEKYTISQLNTEPYFSLAAVEEYLSKPENDYTRLSLSSGDNVIQFNMNANTSGNTIISCELNFTFHWGETLEQTAQVINHAKNVVNSIITPSMSDYTKIKALHDYIVNEFSYDTEYKSYFPYQLITTKKGVCQAYSGYFKKLLEIAGFESYIILIDSTATNTNNITEPHSWNIVKLDGQWYHIDVTWDDPVTASSSVLSHTYFLKSDATMRKNRSWPDNIYPKAPSDYIPVSTPPTSSDNVKSSYKSSISSAVDKNTSTSPAGSGRTSLLQDHTTAISSSISENHIDKSPESADINSPEPDSDSYSTPDNLSDENISYKKEKPDLLPGLIKYIFIPALIITIIFIIILPKLKSKKR